MRAWSHAAWSWRGPLARGRGRPAPDGIRQARSGPAIRALRPAVSHLVHHCHGVAQLLNPLRLVIADQSHAPGEGFAAAPRDPGADQGVEHAAVCHAQPRHHGYARRGEQDSGVAADGPPRHSAPEGRLRLVGNADARPSALLAKAADTGLLSHSHLVVACSFRQLRRRQGAEDLNLVVVDGDGGAALEPGPRYSPAEPGSDQTFLLRPGWWWRRRAAPPALWASS